MYYIFFNPASSSASITVEGMQQSVCRFVLNGPAADATDAPQP
jgi:hypothetical protein